MTASPDIATGEPLSTRRQVDLMRELQRLASERWNEETRIETALSTGLRAAEETPSANQIVADSHGAH